MIEEKSQPNRYSIITEKNPREIVMLRGSGCKWRRCRFCDYHFDFSRDDKANFLLNKEQLMNVTGMYHRLEVINSGSFSDLDERTISFIEETCMEKSIEDLHFESHWIHRHEAPILRKRFEAHNIRVHIKSGVETFCIPFRETVLCKGFGQASPQEIAGYFDDVCLLFGLKGQTADTMVNDIKTGLKYFDRVCVNIMVENSMPLKPDKHVIREFTDLIYPIYKDNERIDILLANTDFGVGNAVNYPNTPASLKP